MIFSPVLFYFTNFHLSISNPGNMIWHMNDLIHNTGQYHITSSLHMDILAWLNEDTWSDNNQVN